MTIALIVCIAGGVIYAVCEGRSVPAFVAEIGRLAFFAGLLAFLIGK